VFRSGEYPVLNLASPKGVTGKAQRKSLDLIAELNQRHLETHPDGTELEARIASYELAFRMQSSAPEAVDLSKESDATKALYGIGQPQTDDFGRKCLLARRLVERGVRFIQLYSGTISARTGTTPITTSTLRTPRCARRRTSQSRVSSRT
jgi:hypothetical protein